MSEDIGPSGEVVGDFVPGGKVLLRYVPNILEKLYHLMWGPKIHLYGHNRAGKTSFIRYLLTSTPAYPDISAKRTETEVTKRSLFFKLQGREDQIVRIKALRDRPGQVDGNLHAIRFCQELPHTAIIILDSEFPYQGKSVNSINGFIKDFWEEVRLRNPPIQSKVKRIWVVAKKVDLVDAKKHKRLLERLQKDFLEYSHGIFPESRIRIRGCSLVEGEEWQTLRDRLIRDIFSDVVFSE